MYTYEYKHHYVYYSYEEWGRGYIGRRECDCTPEEDTKYFGSFTDKTFKPTKKIILQVFNTLEEASVAEVILHDFYQVDVNPHFANRAKAVSSGFYFRGAGENNPMFGKVGDVNPNYGKKWFTNGQIDVFCFNCPEGFCKGRSGSKGDNNPTHGRKGSDNPCLGFLWFTNGAKNIRAFECPTGFVPGRANTRKWFTNGENNVFSSNCPNEYKPGRTIKNKETNYFYAKLHKENHPSYGKKWFNNGIKNVLAYDCPEEFKPGLLRKKNKK
jgi:hypothetical protein